MKLLTYADRASAPIAEPGKTIRLGLDYCGLDYCGHANEGWRLR